MLITLIIFNYTKYESEVKVPILLDFIEELEEIPIRTIHTPKVKKLKPLVVEPLSSEVITPPDENIEYVDEIPKEIVEDELDVEINEDLMNTRSTPEQEEILPPEIPSLLEEAEEIKAVFIAEYMPAYSICKDELDENVRRDCTSQKVTQESYSYITYPAIARENGIEGTVVIEFLVGKNGQMKDAKILKEIGSGCGEEALRAIKHLKDWTAGKQNGKPVHVLYRIPIRFGLN